MGESFITCTSVGVYGHALTKGKHYEVMAEDVDKYRVVGNYGRTIWISKHYFVRGIVEVPVLTGWQFDDDLDSFDLIEVTVTFSNGVKRWCLVTTPHRLVKHFDQSNFEPPGVNIRHLIILKTLDKEDIDKTLKYLDEQDELEEATKPICE